MTTVISVENLTKRYDLGVIGTGTISRDLNRWWARIRKQPDPYTRIGQKDAFSRIGESILALDDVSFQVKQGEALGIIGRNGAGKSTLLKILSRVTAPTSGVVKIKGRIGSLLEVGTGFHPELTGRENVYLNGAILGMKKAEVTRKFDEIIDFAGVEKFIDTPVKRYSSGMYVRLAFAVAAHLDPEILIVDEVLAVGDAEFQKKCLGKMGDVAGEGRTVLFVSHNMAAIENLCPQTIILNHGILTRKGKTDSIISTYLSDQMSIGQNTKHEIFSDANGILKLLSVEIEEKNANQVGIIRCGRDVIVTLTLDSLKPIRGVTYLIALKDSFGNRIAVLNNTTAGYQVDLPKGIHRISCQIPQLPLSMGNYEIELKILSGVEQLIWVPKLSVLTIEMGDYYGSGKLPNPKWSGVCLLQQYWEID